MAWGCLQPAGGEGDTKGPHPALHACSPAGAVLSSGRPAALKDSREPSPASAWGMEGEGGLSGAAPLFWDPIPTKSARCGGPGFPGPVVWGGRRRGGRWGRSELLPAGLLVQMQPGPSGFPASCFVVPPPPRVPRERASGASPAHLDLRDPLASAMRGVRDLLGPLDPLVHQGPLPSLALIGRVSPAGGGGLGSRRSSQGHAFPSLFSLL